MFRLPSSTDVRNHGAVAQCDRFLPLLAAGILGGANLIGQSMANSANEKMAKDAAGFNAVEAEKNRVHQRDMAGTAYQVAMKDMKLAGLNPMLAYSQGGAAMGSGSSASMTPAHVENALGPAVATGMQAFQLKSALENTQSQTKVNEAVQKTNETQAAKNVADAMVSAKQAAKLDAETTQIKRNEWGSKGKNELEKFLYDKMKTFLDFSGKGASDLSDDVQNALQGKPIPNNHLRKYPRD